VINCADNTGERGRRRVPAWAGGSLGAAEANRLLDGFLKTDFSFRKALPGSVLAAQ